MALAIITGGSSGIGLEFAKELAARGLDLVIIARGKDRLEQVCQELATTYQVKVQSVVADLADQRSVDKIAEMIGQTKHLAYLINNAGFAVHEDMTDGSVSASKLRQSAIQVMATDMAIFSSVAAMAMKKNSQGRIINIASTAAWTYQGSYSAIKRFVLTYTQSLALSLTDSGVTATAVCPAWMHTNFHKAAGLGEPAIPEWLYVKPVQVVKQGLKAADKGKWVVVPTWRWRLIIWCLTHGPVALRRRMTRLYLGSGNYHEN